MGRLLGRDVGDLATAITADGVRDNKDIRISLCLPPRFTLLAKEVDPALHPGRDDRDSGC